MQKTYANTCHCNQGKLYSIDIDELNGIHPHQLTLKPDNAYYQLINDKGHVIQDKLYDINAYEDGRIVAKRNGFFGALDAVGNVILDFKYDEIEALDNGFYQLTEYFGSKPATAITKASGNWLYPASGTFDKNTQVDYLYTDKVNNINYFTISKTSKHGLINDKNQTLIAPIYDELALIDTCPNERLFMKAVIGGKTGLIDQYQKIVVPFAKNIDIESFNEDKQIFSVKSYVLRKNEDSIHANNENISSETLINGKGVSIIKSDVRIEALNSSLYKYKKSDKYGIINRNGITVLPANFDYLYGHYDASILAAQNQKIGILTKGKDDNPKIDTFYDFLEPYYDTTYTLSEIETQSLKDEEEYEEEQIGDNETIYESTSAVEVEITEKTNSMLEAITYNPPKTSYIAQINHKLGLVDSNNKVLIPIIYDELSAFERFIKVKKDNKYGLITENNDIIKLPIYDDITPLNDSHGDSIGMVFTKDRQQQLTNKFGHIIAEFSDYRFVNDKLDYLDNMSVIEKNGKYGLFSFKEKKVVIQPIYEDMYERIYNDSILAQLNGRKVLINTSGKVLINDLSQYTEINRSNDSDKIKVRTKDNKHGLIDYTGKTIIAPIYDSIETSKLSNDYVDVWSEDKIENSIERYIVEKKGKYGVFDPSGKLIMPIAYTHIQSILYPAYFLVTKDEVNDENIDSAETINFGLMSPEGKLVLEMKYDAIVHNYYNPEGKIYAIDTHQNSVDIYDKTLKFLETQNLTTFESNNEWYKQQ